MQLRLQRPLCQAIFASVVLLLFVNAAYAARPLLEKAAQSKGTMSHNQIAVSGVWNFQTRHASLRPAIGSMQIEQDGNAITGRARDNFGDSVIKGQLSDPNRLTFVKQYVGRYGDPIDRPITYDGIVGQDKNSGLLIKGQWNITLPSGNFRQRSTVMKQGQWFAKLVKPITKSRSYTASAPAPVSQFEMPRSTREEEVKSDLRDKLTKLVLMVLGVTVVVFVFSINYFKPSGILDRMTQKQYIPTQVRTQHQKLRAEWAKPLRPGGVPLGRRYEWRWWRPWGGKDLSLPPEQRSRNPHMLVLGVGGKGKSRLIANMITHDIEVADRAVVLVDSNGELTELIMRWISVHPEAKKIAKRTVLVDPANKSCVTGYDPLAKPDNGDLQAAASAIVHGFKALYTESPGAPGQWNPQTANILRNASLLLIANDRKLDELPSLLQDNNFRDILLEAVEKRRSECTEYGALLEAWTQYKKLARTEQWIDWVEPILNRIGPVLSDMRIRTLITEPEVEINFRDVIRERKVVLVKLPQSDFGQNANLFGSLIVTGVQQAALAIYNGSAPHPTALYLDEFDKFIEKETLKSITSETQTLQIGLIGVGKTLQRIPEDYRSGIVINMGIINSFALTKKDADVLGPQMFRVDGRKERHQTVQDVVNRVNNSPQFLLITDEEKLNIDRLAGQENRNFFCYRVGSVAGVFQMQSHDFQNIDDALVNQEIISLMRNQKPASNERHDSQAKENV